ncbi:hypothetical protein ACFW1A_35980 [Kitasatospora sp. NPDC058965]|uniref:hypothetical protein n=1 Tax=Kitasatospora sp. NPDC058965 TaxID=3346682 RepID=UPI0036916AC1
MSVTREGARGRRAARTGTGRVRIAAGLAMIAVSWPLYWTTVGPFLLVLFCVLWTGYVLCVDGVVHRRTGRSALDRSPLGFAALFLLSSGFWWLYELFNLATHNWAYVVPDQPGPALFRLEKTLCFATVLPALVETADLLRSLRPARPEPADDRTVPRPVLAAVAVLGALCAGAVLVRPHDAYMLMWFVVFLVLDPLNARAGGRSLLVQIRRGHWGEFAVWSLAGLGCGFLWEMWNSGTAAQWIYDTPGVNGAPHLFRMPLPGFAGYLPFAWSAYAVVEAAARVLRLPLPAPGAPADR